MQIPVIQYISPNSQHLERFADRAETYFEGQTLVYTFRDGPKALKFLRDFQAKGKEVTVCIVEDTESGNRGIDLLTQVYKQSPTTRTVLLANLKNTEDVGRAKNKANLLRFVPPPFDMEQVLSAAQQGITDYSRSVELLEYTQMLQNLNTSIQSISGELNYDRLVNRILEYLITNTGADRAFLIRDMNGRLYLQAAIAKDEDQTAALAYQLENERKELSQTIVEQMNAEMENATQGFRKSDTIVSPVEKKEARYGYLMLEMVDEKSFFSRNHLQILEMMANQMRISLENVDLYTQLENQQRKLEENIQLLEQKNEDVVSSIVYAERIQKATFPSNELIQHYIPRHFVLFQPREIVSGDFYWFGAWEDKFLLAVADCSSYGVPGAFLSLLSTNYLNRAVNEYQITEPAAILEFIDMQLQQDLKQGKSTKADEEEDIAYQSIQIALCMYDPAAEVLVYCGAGLPMYLIREGHFFEAPSNDQRLGNQSRKQVFEARQLTLQPNDQIYLLTDGLANHLATKESAETGWESIQQLLSDIWNLPVEEQREAIRARVKETTANAERQRDDITVLGLRFSSVQEPQETAS